MSDESHCLENDEKIRSVSLMNKKKKEMQIDRLSALPDSLLLHILSFLDMRRIARTVVLSKRWRFLWTDMSSLIFYEHSSEIEKTIKFLAWVHRALVVCGGSHLEEFVFGFEYTNPCAPDVNLCIQFVLKNKVKDFSLLLNCYEDLFVPPQLMYSNPFFTCLRLRGCIIAPRITIDWGSLTVLKLENLAVRDHVMDKIFSGCPVLYELNIWKCAGLRSLEVNSRSLHELTIEECYDFKNESLIEISVSAPYINSLTLSLDFEGSKVRLAKLSPHVVTDIDFNGFGCDAGSVEMMNYTTGLFEDIRHVKNLELGHGCIEILSAMARRGWRLPQSGREHLIVNAQRDEHSTSVILDLVESSPILETLVVHWTYFSYEECEHCHPHSGESQPKKVDLNCDLLHLKTVYITCCIDPDTVAETLLKVVQLLLQRAKVLEKMVIGFRELRAPSDSVGITETLLSYPRASPKAVLVFN